jgi:hypothetical protein
MAGGEWISCGMGCGPVYWRAGLAMWRAAHSYWRAGLARWPAGRSRPFPPNAGPFRNKCAFSSGNRPPHANSSGWRRGGPVNKCRPRSFGLPPNPCLAARGDAWPPTHDHFNSFLISSSTVAICTVRLTTLPSGPTRNIVGSTTMPYWLASGLSRPPACAI